jgi:hypothetical protein
MATVMIEAGIQAYGLAAMMRILKIDPDEATMIFKDGVKAVKNRHTHMYIELYVYCSYRAEFLLTFDLVALSPMAGSLKTG